MNEIKVVFEAGRSWDWTELPPRSIALDGAVAGPRFESDRRIWSFDHHSFCYRHATLSTCEQVRDALQVGLNPDGYTVFINDVDGDTSLSLWLLLHPLRLRGKTGRRLHALVNRVGRSDALGPAMGPIHPLHRLLTLPPERVATTGELEANLALLERWWNRESLPPPAPLHPSQALWVKEDALYRGPVSNGFSGLYRRAPFGILTEPAPQGTTAYTVGRSSEFVAFDVPRFLSLCDRMESGWGGGSTIGGAPRHPDGRRSCLPIETLSRLFFQFVTGTSREPPVVNLNSPR